MNKKELWLRLAAYQFDHLVPVHLLDAILAKFGKRHASVKAFADKLCRKLHWEREFALRALWEYKKFVYLGVTSDFSVTPSKIIDQVWHEHLLFSAGYRKFCDEIIQHEFDHNPELVPVSSQTEVFMTQYVDTVALYEREFGSEPPNDIWNPTKFTDDREQMKKRLKKQQGVTWFLGDDGSPDTLISMFPSADSSDFEFGGGEFSGAGASGSWDDGSSGGDSGDSSDSCSACSSGCSACSSCSSGGD